MVVASEKKRCSGRRNAAFLLAREKQRIEHCAEAERKAPPNPKRVGQGTVLSCSGLNVLANGEIFS
jgi:hypothetical protein